MKLPRVTFTTLSILLSVVSISTASPDSEKLRQATFFAVGRIDDGQVSEGERNLRAVLRQPDAQEEFSELLGSASAAGQMYALVGLRLLDRDADLIAAQQPRRAVVRRADPQNPRVVVHW